jgi:hypothetical protein
MGRGERFGEEGRSVSGVIGEEKAEGGEEEVLGALAGAREEEAGGFGGVAREGVADGLLEILLEGGIVIGEAEEERIPKLGGGLGIVMEGDKLCEIVIWLMGREFARREIEGTIKEINKVGMGVEGGMRHSDAREHGGEAEKSGEAREGRAAFNVLEDAFAEAGVFAIERGGEFVAGIEGGGGEFEDVIVVEEPAGAVEEEPAPGGDVTDEVAELLDEAAGIAPVGEVVSGEEHERDALIVGGAVLGLIVRGGLELFVFWR